MPPTDLLTEKLRTYRQLDSRGLLVSGSSMKRIELRNAGTIHVAGVETGWSRPAIGQ